MLSILSFLCIHTAGVFTFGFDSFAHFSTPNVGQTTHRRVISHDSDNRKPRVAEPHTPKELGDLCSELFSQVSKPHVSMKFFLFFRGSLQKLPEFW